VLVPQPCLILVYLNISRQKQIFSNKQKRKIKKLANKNTLIHFGSFLKQFVKKKKNRK